MSEPTLIEMAGNERELFKRFGALVRDEHENRLLGLAQLTLRELLRAIAEQEADVDAIRFELVKRSRRAV